MMQTALILDDDDAKSRLIAAYLYGAGYDVVDDVDTISKAEDLLAKKNYDSIIIDYFLNGESGYVLYEKIKKLPRVFLYSGNPKIAPEEAQKSIIEFPKLLEIIGSWSKNKSVKTETDTFYREKLMCISEKVAQHDIILSNHSESIREIKDTMKKIYDMVVPIGPFIENRGKDGPRIMWLIGAGFVLISTVMLIARFIIGN